LFDLQRNICDLAFGSEINAKLLSVAIPLPDMLKRWGKFAIK